MKEEYQTENELKAYKNHLTFFIKTSNGVKWSRIICRKPQKVCNKSLIVQRGMMF